MASIPKVVTNMKPRSVGVVNSILQELEGVGAPQASNTLESIKSIGNYINSYQPRYNQFYSTLVNRIILSIIVSKMYENPWKMFKKGMLDASGETIEEIFNRLPEVHEYNNGDNTNSVLAALFGKSVDAPLVAYHQINFTKYYDTSIDKKMSAMAFNSLDGLESLIQDKIRQLYAAMSYDEYWMMRFTLAQAALDGKITPITISDPTASESNAKAAVKKIRSLSNNMVFKSAQYTMAGVLTETNKEDQIVICDTDVDASIGVDVLAVCFNKSEVDYSASRILCDKFTDEAVARLNTLLNIPEGSTCLSSDDITALNTIYMYVVDKDFLMIYDKLIEVTEQPNPLNFQIKYFLHHWASFSASPFKQAAMLTSTVSAVSAVSVTPSTADAAVGSSLVFTASVTKTGFVSDAVIWSVTGGAAGKGTKISSDGVLTIGAAETAQTLTVKATSAVDSSVYGTAVVTLVAST